MKTPRRPAKILAALAALLVAGSIAGYLINGFEGFEAQSPAVSGRAARWPDSVMAAEALAQLERIPVRGRAPKKGYSRDKFGPVWADVDGNGCDTRNDILARDLMGETFKPGTSNCVAATGTLTDKHTGITINFVHGLYTSSAVQIDHIVSLGRRLAEGGSTTDGRTADGTGQRPVEPRGHGRTYQHSQGRPGRSQLAAVEQGISVGVCSSSNCHEGEIQARVTQPERDAIAGVLQRC